MKREFGIPEGATVVAVIPFGLPDEKPGLRAKKPITVIVHLDTW